MIHMESFVHWSVNQLVGKAVGSHSLKLPIPTYASARNPRPAFIRAAFVYFLPKPFLTSLGVGRNRRAIFADVSVVRYAYPIGVSRFATTINRAFGAFCSVSQPPRVTGPAQRLDNSWLSTFKAVIGPYLRSTAGWRWVISCSAPSHSQVMLRAHPASLNATFASLNRTERNWSCHAFIVHQ